MLMLKKASKIRFTTIISFICNFEIQNFGKIIKISRLLYIYLVSNAILVIIRVSHISLRDYFGNIIAILF